MLILRIYEKLYVHVQLQIQVRMLKSIMIMESSPFSSTTELATTPRPGEPG